MRCGQVAVSILNLMQVLDEEIAPPRLIAEQRHDILASLRVDLPPFWR
jgi:hypothetical protein